MSNRYEELDSLRGLAALTVFFSHMYLVFNENSISKLLFEFGPFRPFVAGSEAVTLFFVLSGFVLSIPYYSGKQNIYGSYLIKRFFRIYIPYIIAILFSLVSREMFYRSEIPGLTNWFNINWSNPINIRVIIDHFIMIGTFSSNLDNVVWSLIHEMRISLLFPLIMYLILKFDIKKNIGLSLVLSALSVIYASLIHPSFWGTEWYVSLHYSSLFVLGALIARYKDILQNFFVKKNSFLKVLGLFGGLILYYYAHPSFILKLLIPDIAPFYRTVIDSWFIACGAGILIIFSFTSKKLSELLKNKFVVYFGKISYSLYLVHLTILFSFIHIFNNILPMGIIMLLVFFMTVFFSSILYYFVEKPSMKFGKQLASFFASKKIMKKKSENNVSVKIV